MDKVFVNVKEAKAMLNVCTRTLQNYDKEGKIEVKRTAGGRRMYNLQKFIKDNNLEDKESIKINKKKVIYCRVSSYERKEDLERQVKFLVNIYPEYEVITDIASGINFKRKGLQKIINYAINNILEEVVVTYKDRLCRIGYDLLDHIFSTYSNTKVIIINNVETNREEEITKDLIEIVTVYSSKIHGIRRN